MPTKNKHKHDYVCLKLLCSILYSIYSFITRCIDVDFVVKAAISVHVQVTSKTRDHPQMKKALFSFQINGSKLFFFKTNSAVSCNK